MFKIIDSPALADELQAAGLLWWKGRESVEWKPDDYRKFTPPSDTWIHNHYAILIED